MNVDEAMAIGRKEKPDWYFNANEAAPILAAEVERLRGELSAEGTAGELILQDNRDLRIENKRLQAELAAAKAASVVPVKWKSVERFFKSGADLGNQWGIEFWFDTKEQRDKFCKWMKERGEG